MTDPLVTDATAIPAEGARVGLVSCLLCGAALLLDPRETLDTVAAHMTWHEGLL